MFNFYVYLAVIVSGAAVLAVEILGTRILAPFYGASLYLWSAMIAVTLAALSLGYAVGGRWADKKTSLRNFSVTIGAAGIWTMLIPWLSTPSLDLTEVLGLRMAVLITATVLFFPPLALLGMISPYAIRLKASTLNVVGTTAGNLYAVSTIASVVAALLTGFILIPNIGVYRLVFIVGLLLLATGIIGIWSETVKKGSAVTPLFLLIALVVGYQVGPAHTPDPDNGIIAVQQSAYAQIRVVDMEDRRLMLIDGAPHTIADTSTWRSYFAYVNVLDIPRLMFKNPGSMLLVGLGGGSLAKSYSHAGWSVDAVEIDPVVIELAHSYFGLKPEEANIYNIDGRRYLITHEKQYDLIIMDAFGSSSIPFHLVTEESFGLIHSRLTPEGVLAMNVEAVGWDDILVRSLAATMNEEFKNVLVLPIPEPPNTSGNLILLASDRPLELPSELPPPPDRWSYEYDQNHAWDNRFKVDTAGVPVLTDALNPVDIWAERINLNVRKAIHAYFEKYGIGW